MPRIRTIKPDIVEDDRLAEVDLKALCLFFLMKPFCDDNGIIPANPRLIRSKCFPQREDLRLQHITAMLDNLIAHSFLVLFRHTDGKDYYALDFSSERIDKPQPSILGKEAPTFLSIKNGSREGSRTVANGIAGEEGIGEGMGEERNGSAGAQTEPPGPHQPKSGSEPKAPPLRGAPPKNVTEIGATMKLPWDTDTFRSDWLVWKLFKYEEFSFQYKGLVSEQQAMVELAEMAEGDEKMAHKILKHTIGNRWKGFVKPKADNSNGQSSNQKGNTGAGGLNADHKRDMAQRLASVTGKVGNAAN